MVLFVHSTDSRSEILKIWQRCFDKHIHQDIEVRYILGKGHWTSQIMEALTPASEDYIFYTLDDYWIVQFFDFAKWQKMAEERRTDAIRLQPNVNLDTPHYKLELVDGLMKQLPESAYKNTAQTSIWNRRYFLRVLRPGLNPWDWERSVPKVFGDIYFAPYLGFWYINGTLKGEITPEGEECIEML